MNSQGTRLVFHYKKEFVLVRYLRTNTMMSFPVVAIILVALVSSFCILPVVHAETVAECLVRKAKTIALATVNLIAAAHEYLEAQDAYQAACAAFDDVNKAIVKWSQLLSADPTNGKLRNQGYALMAAYSQADQDKTVAIATLKAARAAMNAAWDALVDAFAIDCSCP